MEAFMKSMMEGGGGGGGGGDGGGGGGGGGGGVGRTGRQGGGAVHNDEDGRGGGGGDDVADDGIPFACHLCRGPFKDPIVTPCGHYLNEGCMLQLIRDANGNASCPVCGKDTHGVLNRPAKLIAKKRRLVGRDGTWEEYMEKKRSRGI